MPFFFFSSSASGFWVIFIFVLKFGLDRSMDFTMVVIYSYDVQYIKKSNKNPHAAETEP